jgi:hypothetical protein
MAGVQSTINNAVLAFILDGIGYFRTDAVIAQDAGRTDPLLPLTVMAKTAATQKWVPLTNLAATDGTALAQGIYVGPEIAAADLVAGDVTDASILVGEASVDETQLVLENSLTLDSVMGAGTIDARTVRDQLTYRSIFAESTVAISGYENA